MLIQKKRAVKWSLDQVEAMPGITTQGVMEECIRNMERNGWDFTEMALWFNRQKDPQGRPKFLNAVGEPLNGPAVAHIYKTMRQRKKSKKTATMMKVVAKDGQPKAIPRNVSACEPHREFIRTLLISGKSAADIRKILKVQYGLELGDSTVRTYVRSLRSEAAQTVGDLPVASGTGV